MRRRTMMMMMMMKNYFRHNDHFYGRMKDSSYSYDLNDLNDLKQNHNPCSG